mgnify:FL=1
MFNRQHSQTLLVITHDENIALQADRILVVEDGRIMRDETLRSCPGGGESAMNIVNRLTLRCLRLNKRRTLVTIIGSFFLSRCSRRSQRSSFRLWI